MLLFHHSLFFSKQHSMDDPQEMDPPITSILHFQLRYSFNTVMMQHERIMHVNRQWRNVTRSYAISTIPLDEIR